MFCNVCWPRVRGGFASTELSSGERRLELRFKPWLSLIRCHFGSMALSHEDCMAAKLGRRGCSAHPGFSSDPIDEFRRLRQDLESHCHEFLSGDRAGPAGDLSAAGFTSHIAGPGSRPNALVADWLWEERFNIYLGSTIREFGSEFSFHRRTPLHRFEEVEDDVDSVRASGCVGRAGRPDPRETLPAPKTVPSQIFSN